MKDFKWKFFLITGIVCLLPILFGVYVWEQLPDIIPIHFDINNNPDNYASKEFVVFVLPFIMVILQGICCFFSDLNTKKYGEQKKFELVSKWIIPIVSTVIYVVTLGIAMEKNIDIRIVASLLVGCVLVVTGMCMPELDYVKNYKLDAEKARKINSFAGVGMTTIGSLFLISVFLPPAATVACVVALIPYGIICAIYGMKVSKE